MTKFYLTTPIYYPNARPHVGSAYTTIVCDTIARFKRQCGYEVAFLTGTDEHGEKLERAAAEAGVPPQAFVAEKREYFRRLWNLLDIRYTHFIYTDQPDHIISVQRLLRRARDCGYVYKGHYRGRYCVHCELYISDGAEPATCPNCGRPGELVSEENYFFKLSAFQDKLLALYEKNPATGNPDFVQPDFRLNEVKSFVKSGLRDISISRKRIKWGIPWPDDPDQVFYVWYDALTSYLTGIGFAQGENGNAEFDRYWPADLHMIGKDILRFHAVYWPAFLMAAGLPLPRAIYAHGFLLMEQDKMSKSKGNVVFCEPIVQVLGSDALRYYLLRDVPFGQDSSFSYEGLVQRFNSDLANDLGNLLSRTLKMVDQYFQGRIPAPGAPSDNDLAVKNLAERAVEQLAGNFRLYFFSRGLEVVWAVISRVNQYLVEEQPWSLAGLEERRERLATILWTAAESLRIVAVLLSPVLPKATEQIWMQLGLAGSPVDVLVPHQLRWGDLAPGTRIGNVQPIFPRLEKDEALRCLWELEERERASEITRKESKQKMQPPSQPPAQSKPEAQPPKITIDDFTKIDMRVGEVLSAEPVPGAQKLLKLMVDIGTEVRQVVAGIAGYYQPEQVVGMKVVLVTNLEPRKLRGVESNGMIVAATVGEEGRPVLVTFKEDVPNGAKLK